MTLLAWAAVAVFTVAYILIATEKVHRVAAALGGAALMLLIGATNAEHAFFDKQTGIDWNVLFLLLGMMLIVAVMKRTGGFEYVAIWAAKKARGKPFRVMVILVLVTALPSAAKVMALDERDAIKDPRLLIISGVVLALVTAAFVLHTVLHLDPAVVAMVGGLLLLALSRLDAEAVAKDVEWPTLVFFAGLFIMVGALVNTGVIGQISQAATDAVGGQLWPATMVLLWGSAFLSAIVDNIPYVATMSPIVADLVNGFPKGEGNVLWWALALGADLGGNATAIGASANVVILGMAERAGKRISFWEFTKYGLVVTVVTIALCVPYLWLRYFAFA